MKRRDFITLLGGAAAWPLAARAQQPAIPEVGILSSGTSGQSAAWVRGLLEALGETGYVDGRNVRIEYRWADDQYDRLTALAADLVARRVAVIAANGSPAALAAKRATATIPIVFQIGVDPIEAGLVTSLNRPGGNLTGFVNLALELGPKRLELIHELIPSASAVALLINPTRSTATAELSVIEAAARALKLDLHVLHASSERDFEAAFAATQQHRAGGLVIAGDPTFNWRTEQLAALSLRYRVPAIYQSRAFAAAVGLISYGSNMAQTRHQTGSYVGRVLRGEKPAELPVQQSTAVELIINLKTAKALGLDVPATLLGRADEVIE
jgi:putative tryptophan/tyrosine transport system substrate-binding protein